MATGGLAAETSQPFVSFSRSRNWYANREANGDLTYDNVIHAMKTGVDAGLFEEDRARQGAHLDEVPRQSRFRATPLLIERLGDARFEHLRPASSIIMRDEAGVTVAIPDTERAQRIRKEADGLNEWLSGMRVEVSPDASPEDWQRSRHHLRARKVKDGVETWACALPTPSPEIVRIFGRGRFDCHGRLYGWWQSLPKDRRAELLINGELTVEPDFAMLHPTLLYAMVGATMPRDVYDTGEHERDHGKLALNIGINAKGGLKGAVDALMWRDGWTGTRTYTQGLVDAIAELNAPIAGFLGSDAGVRLMGIDSAMAVEVMKRCRKADIACLPVHDSFRVAAKSGNQVTAIMADVLDATFTRISSGTSTTKRQIILQVPRAGAAALAASPPVPAPVGAPAPSAASPAPRSLPWDPALRLDAMIAYQIGCARAEMAQDRRQGLYTSWTELEAAARRIAKSVCADENATGIRAFPIRIVPDRLGDTKKASPKLGRSRKVNLSQGKGRRPRVTPTEARA
ncbi:hypothetical protein [Methylobacterium sp. Leaf85]|uniref:hypothetical protein n=1 Tax=Methylobacterium sp. Leaf85 TaxID=1736241 RepID=UPI001910012B|nr:hypothetical protein [Methylobacterium sp. Leaf85]